MQGNSRFIELSGPEVNQIPAIRGLWHNVGPMSPSDARLWADAMPHQGPCEMCTDDGDKLDKIQKSGLCILGNAHLFDRLAQIHVRSF